MFVVVVDGAEEPPGVPAEITITPSSVPSLPAEGALSRGRSFGLSAGSLGGLVISWSKAGSEFELDCNLKSTLNFFKLSICFLWSVAIEGGPLQTGLVILGELSKGLIFSLFDVGDVCLVSWTRHSFASPDGEATMLGEGLAAVGEEADVGVAAVSTGAVPVWGDGREEEPAEAPPILFCRGERGLWAPLTTEDHVPPEELLLLGGVTGTSPGALWEIKSTPAETPVVLQGGTL